MFVMCLSVGHFLFLLVYIIMEYLEKGALHSLLQREKERISQRDLARFACDIACGMDYLSTNRVGSLIVKSYTAC